MLTQMIIKKFVNDHENTQDKKVREAFGVVSSVTGMAVNFILFLIGFIIGLSINSIAVIANSFNSLSDATSSIIILAGFKLSNRVADREHPFGYGRIEYLSALIVAALILMMGFEFIKSSFSRIINPMPMEFDFVSFIIIIAAIPLKFWLSNFNKSIGRKIDSKALLAAGADSFNDMLILACIIFSLIMSNFFNINIDGYVGMAVALLIIWAGISIMKETLGPILGQPPDAALVQELKRLALSYENIKGVHDIIVHNYGPGRSMASFHAEVPNNVDIMALHEDIDRAEKEISEKLNIFVVIHMDPICMDCETTIKAMEEVAGIIRKIPDVSSFHDFRVVGDGEFKSLIFDIVIPFNKKEPKNIENSLKDEIAHEVNKIHPKYDIIITVDRDYTAAEI
ncbi:ferrous-iron efflux pump FieF [Oxobacter pfennigii]|uniref:Ferrous-iron efflux pump FieF n=2 Tax=Oxobacter pfennigii TaxID=36849 RepID=A0A0P8WAI9_9CLOT|nr:cation diffusion facilitator family transporter [Oxobacter pfennigii]KPU45634.1 ferrous-iron efflux pump FieF [Oxobacter pfennigii]